MCIRNKRRRLNKTIADDVFSSSPSSPSSSSSRYLDSSPPDNSLTSKPKIDTKKREIQHNYHDHANDDGAIYLNTPVISKGGVTVPFPEKLHNMLEHIAQNEPELSSIISWQPHGRCFLVKDAKAFGANVLPRFFEQKKYASFQRQLNLYGFSRLTKGADRGSYYHELFLRSKKILCRGIQRMKVKGTGSRMASNPDQEPKFYLMSSMPLSKSIKHQSIVPTNNSAIPSTTVSSHSSYQIHYPKMVQQPLPLHSSNYVPRERDFYREGDTEEDLEDLDLVFGNMPFHVLSSTSGSRRHSLMDSSRRLSATFGAIRSRRNSIIVAGDEFDKEMEVLFQLGETDLSDYDMSNILDKIIDHRVL